MAVCPHVIPANQRQAKAPGFPGGRVARASPVAADAEGATGGRNDARRLLRAQSKDINFSGFRAGKRELSKINFVAGEASEYRSTVPMEDAPPTAEEYRDTAEGIREMARRATSDEIRRELLDLAERYDRGWRSRARRTEGHCV